MTSPEFFAQVEYFLCVLVQLSIICFFGNEITIAVSKVHISVCFNRIFVFSVTDSCFQSAQTGVSLYECDWFGSSLRFKRSMIMTISRMQRPVYVSIGKFSPLTLATLVTVSIFLNPNGFLLKIK